MYNNEILRGIDFLISVQNPDGGIPAMRATDPSACWTTAEALESILLSPFLRLSYHSPVIKMIDFLLNSQIKSGNEKGAWPEYLSTQYGQTLTTGHSIAALRLARDIIVDDADFTTKITDAIKSGIDYLNRVQNSDGGWCIQTSDGDTESRSFSTFFVLRGYITNGYYYDNWNAVRNACNYLMTLYDSKSGGFSKTAGEAPDPCYTARIVSVLFRAKARSKKDKMIRRAIKFIFSDKSLKSLLKVKHEAFHSTLSAGMVIFHSNTPIDVMEALCLCGIYDRRVRKLGEWIQKTQEHSGGWYLGGTRNPEINEGVITWTTNEAIYALTCYNTAFSDNYQTVLQKRAKLYRSIIIALVIITFCLLVSPVQWLEGNWPLSLWKKLPELARKLVLGSALGVAGLNVLSNFLYDKIKKWRRDEEPQ